MYNDDNIIAYYAVSDPMPVFQKLSAARTHAQYVYVSIDCIPNSADY